MATTTNYGWTTPNDTDLVKDGAAAIRTLGSSIDTTTKALNPSTTLGDIEYRSSTANTNTRLGIGTSGQVLSVSGGVPAWVTSSSGGMTLLSTTTLSGATTTISSINQTYTKLQIYVYGVTNATANDQFFLRLNGNYEYGVYQRLNNGTAGAEQGNEIYFGRSGQETLRTNANNSWSVEIDNYASSTFYKTFKYYGSYINTSSAKQSIMGLGGWQDNTAVTSVVFGNYGGNLSTGTVLVYGVK